ncbi:MAG: phenylalanine--tRNA ligase subunit beta [Sphingosinicella sp.]
MKFTYSWLRDHLDTEADAAAIAARLTAIGLEVEALSDPAARLAPFIVAEVIEAAPHPQADKLQVLKVNTGSGEAVQVVCGAANAHAGMKGVFAAPGTYVPGSDLTLKVAAIRGVESRGMLCSIRELELGDEHEGIIELPADAPVGGAFAPYYRLDDPLFDVAITPNRPDAMGVYGIARDLAAAGLGSLKPLQVPKIEGAFPCPIEIRTDDPEGCPAFYGRVVRGLANRPSPDWLQRRLRAIGQRPISALVDLTNYLMLSFARPLHVYDLAKLNGPLVARRAKAGEEMVALNGRAYRLDETMTVIADGTQVHDIGGIMGGEHSGVTEATTDIVIECAYFDPTAISRTGQRLALVSDARARFERGVDPAFLDAGLALATQMAIELCGGEPSAAVHAGRPPLGPRRVAYLPARCRTLAGIDLAEDRQKAILASLGFGISIGEDWQIRIPSWRPDVTGAADIVEEVARIEGFERIESTPLPRPAGIARPTATNAQRLERKARRAAAARGLNEAVTCSFISEAEAEPFCGSARVLANPISEEMKAMRPSLLPSLLGAARRNLDRGASSVRLFEVGHRYLGESEPLTLALVLAGERTGRHWRIGRSQPFDAFDAKADALAVLAAAGAPVESLQLIDDAPSTYHPGQSGRLALGAKNVLAEFGALHPALLKRFDLEPPVVAAELFLDAIPERRAGRRRPHFTPPPLQPVTRDFAFLVDADLPADLLLRAVRGANRDHIVSVTLFDLFTGHGVAESKKSMAIEVVLQPAERSFTDEQLQAISARIVAAAAKLGAELRS